GSNGGASGTGPVGVRVQPGGDVARLQFVDAGAAGEGAEVLQEGAIPLVRLGAVVLHRGVEEEGAGRGEGRAHGRAGEHRLAGPGHDLVVAAPSGLPRGGVVLGSFGELDLLLADLDVEPAVEAAVEGLRVLLLAFAHRENLPAQ